MKALYGLLGVIFFAIGGASLFYQLSIVLGRNTYFTGAFDSFLGYGIGFFLVGLGLWVIVLSGKPDTKQTSS
jgi:hypothetical protein